MSSPVHHLIRVASMAIIHVHIVATHFVGVIFSCLCETAGASGKMDAEVAGHNGFRFYVTVCVCLSTQNSLSVDYNTDCLKWP